MLLFQITQKVFPTPNGHHLFLNHINRKNNNTLQLSWISKFESRASHKFLNHHYLTMAKHKLRNEVTQSPHQFTNRWKKKIKKHSEVCGGLQVHRAIERVFWFLQFKKRRKKRDSDGKYFSARWLVVFWFACIKFLFDNPPLNSNTNFTIVFISIQYVLCPKI